MLAKDARKKDYTKDDILWMSRIIESESGGEPISGKVAVVTGAGGVLCSYFSLVLARAGAKVALLGRHIENISEVHKQIIDEGGIAKPYVCDVLDKARCEEVASFDACKIEHHLSDKTFMAIKNHAKKFN